MKRYRAATKEFTKCPTAAAVSQKLVYENVITCENYERMWLYFK
jgi:hypothetical protein